jgi:hypothetical protein
MLLRWPQVATYMPSFIKIGPEAVKGPTHTHTSREQADLLSLFFNFKMRKVD